MHSDYWFAKFNARQSFLLYGSIRSYNQLVHRSRADSIQRFWHMHMQWLPGSLSPPKRAWDRAMSTHFIRCCWGVVHYLCAVTIIIYYIAELYNIFSGMCTTMHYEYHYFHIDRVLPSLSSWSQPCSTQWCCFQPPCFCSHCLYYLPVLYIWGMYVCIIESVDSISRDGPAMPIYYVKEKTQSSYSFKVFKLYKCNVRLISYAASPRTS